MKINIDKLEIAFERCNKFESKFKNYTLQDEEEQQQETRFETRFGDYTLSRDKDYRTTYKNAYAVYHLGYRKVGWIYWETYQINRNEHIYFKAHNEILYTDWATIVESIEANLNLKFSYISKLDICVDTRMHIVKTLRCKMKNKSIIWVINGSKVKNTKKNIEGLNEEDRSLYVEQEEGLRLAIYDKTREIEEKSYKYYIIEDEEQECDIYRAEVRMQRKQISKYIKDKNINDLELFQRLKSKANLRQIFDDQSKKLLRWWENKNLKGVLDICGKEGQK